MWITVRNLQIVDSRSEPYFVWKPSTGLEPPAPPPVGLDNLAPEDPPANGVSFSAQLLGAQRGTCTVRLEIFDTADNRTRFWCGSLPTCPVQAPGLGGGTAGWTTAQWRHVGYTPTVCRCTRAGCRGRTVTAPSRRI